MVHMYACARACARRQMGARDVAAVTSLSLQKKLRENAVQSAAMLLMRDEEETTRGTRRIM